MSYRDTIRQQHATKDAAIRQLGINVDDIRKESRTRGAVQAMTTRLMNESTNTAGHERIAEDDFATGVFDGINQDYTLTRRVLGQNILCTHYVEVSGSKTRLTRTTNPAPSAGQFYFDGFFGVRVGTAPQPLDALAAQYITAL